MWGTCVCLWLQQRHWHGTGLAGYTFRRFGYLKPDKSDGCGSLLLRGILYPSCHYATKPLPTVQLNHGYQRVLPGCSADNDDYGLKRFWNRISRRDGS